MPIMSGLEAAQKILVDFDQAPAIIFCTAHDEFALDAFKTSAVSYLLKPVSREDIRTSISAATRLNKPQLSKTLQQNERDAVDNLVISDQEGYSIIDIAQVVYFHIDNKCVFAGSQDGQQHFIDESLKDLESRFADNLLRVHRSTLINIDYLQRLYRDSNNSLSVQVRGLDRSFVVSRRHTSDVKRYFKNHNS